MEPIIRQALESDYEDYFLLGRRDGVLCVETSAAYKAVRRLFRDVQASDEQMKWWLLECVLKVFETASDDDYVKFLDYIRRTKCERYDNRRHGRIPSVGADTPTPRRRRITIKEQKEQWQS